MQLICLRTLYGKKPDVKRLRVLGCPVFVHKQTADTKLQPKAEEGVFVGYSTKANAYLVLVRNRLRTVRDLVFDEHLRTSKKMQEN